MSDNRLFIGCAGWAIPAAFRSQFPPQGSQLERYARIFSAVEINSSFYRPHRATTYARWKDSVPDRFRFSVKLPRSITHEARLNQPEAQLEQFCEASSRLGCKLGSLLVQLPPSLKYEQGVAQRFFHFLRQLTSVAVCCEPRHSTWGSTSATEILTKYGISRVCADPPAFRSDGALVSPTSFVYYRLHGSPQMYYSKYSQAYLETLASKLRHELQTHTCWCVFDNTAAGGAAENALKLLELLGDMDRNVVV